MLVLPAIHLWSTVLDRFSRQRSSLAVKGSKRRKSSKSRDKLQPDSKGKPQQQGEGS
jgi:hypothetical protein